MRLSELRKPILRRMSKMRLSSRRNRKYHDGRMI
jgi:hypothetical protein